MAATIKLTKVSIGSDKHFSTFDTSGGLVTDEITLSEYTNIFTEIPTKEDGTWRQSSTKISFDTSTGELSDKQYATQENGFHWVKIPDYAVTKIDPKFIDKDLLSADGVADVKERSEAE